MIKHIVMFKLKEFESIDDKQNAALAVKNNFENLKDLIEDISFYEVGINISSSPSAFDLVINSEFETIEQLKKYSNHHEHIKAVELNKQFSIDKVVVDYEF